MKMQDHVLPATALLLIFCLLAGAGCTSIPGPDVRFTPSPTKTPVQVTPQVKTTTLQLTQAPNQPAVTAAVTTKTTPASKSAAYESRTCAQQDGTIARPGQQCPGTWLNAADTFNCCSEPPVREFTGNTSLTVEPFDLVIDIDDDPGSILP